jgi:large subunit ribosomal protein L17
MRHGNKLNHLGRDNQHRKALLKNMSISLILHKRIYTTVAKAKALRIYVEPLLTRGKTDTTHNRRMVFSYLQSKDAIKELFGEVSTKIATRPGGYTRIIKTGFRQGDNAEMCMMELVDYNTIYGKAAEEASKTRRSRRSRAKAGAEGASTTTTTAAGLAAAAVAVPMMEETNEEFEAETSMDPEVETPSEVAATSTEAEATEAAEVTEAQNDAPATESTPEASSDDVNPADPADPESPAATDSIE